MRLYRGGVALIAAAWLATGCADHHAPGECQAPPPRVERCDGEGVADNAAAFACAVSKPDGTLQRLTALMEESWDRRPWACEMLGIDGKTARYSLHYCSEEVPSASGRRTVACPLPRDPTIERVSFVDGDNWDPPRNRAFEVADFAALGPQGGCLEWRPRELCTREPMHVDEVCFESDSDMSDGRPVCGGPAAFVLRADEEVEVHAARCEVTREGRDLFVTATRGRDCGIAGVTGDEHPLEATCAFRAGAPGDYRVWLPGRDEPVRLPIQAKDRDAGDRCFRVR